MATIKLGRLEEVDVRKLWSHEQYDFSNWLAKEENIELLNEALGLTLVDIEKEVYVGSYRCDLVASDETTGQKIIIENQLEQSNHDHLGKVITYASGLDAKVIVWIVKDAREEHRSAVEWLNNNTNKEINFFLIEIHAYKIGDSLYAPKFEIVEKPNDFIKTGKIQASSGEMNKSQSERLAFWTRFNEVIIERGRPFNVRKASTDHWYDVAIGTSAAHLGMRSKEALNAHLITSSLTIASRISSGRTLPLAKSYMMTSPPLMETANNSISKFSDSAYLYTPDFFISTWL